MLSPEQEAKIREIISECSPEAFIIELELHMSKRHQLKVFIDTDEGITLKKCTEISRKISRWLDEGDEIKSAYNLEVSSPGIGNPFQVFRQYKKNIGRKVGVVLISGERKEGELIEANEDSIKIRPTVKGKPKRQDNNSESLEIRLEEIKETKVLVSF